MTQAYTGVFPIAPTPFREDGALDLESQRRVLDCMVDQGVDGICILANYSEQFLLSDEERGRLLDVCMTHVAGRVPVVVTITGEGGSGGALAIGVGDRVLMLEHAVYSVISPEGCAAILWKNQDKKKEAATNLKLTADQLLKLGVIDEIVTEAIGGAHSDHKTMAEILDGFLLRSIEQVENLNPEERVRSRYDKFRKMGLFNVSK